MFDKFSKGFYFSPDGNGGAGEHAGSPLPGKASAGDLDGNNSGDGSATGQTTENETFEAYLAKQPEPIRKMYQEHNAGLLNTVKATRQERDEALQIVKDLKPKAEKGSEMEKVLDEATKRMEAADRRANFAEDAIKPEIGCVNVKAAYAIAVSDELFDRRGLPEWDAIKKAAPELFRKPSKPQGNAGDGTGEGANSGTQNMDDVIRARAGVR